MQRPCGRKDHGVFKELNLGHGRQCTESKEENIKLGKKGKWVKLILTIFGFILIRLNPGWGVVI